MGSFIATVANIRVTCTGCGATIYAVEAKHSNCLNCGSNVVPDCKRCDRPMHECQCDDECDGCGEFPNRCAC